jgi:hypothetical protein
MHSKQTDVPVAMEVPEGKMRFVEWGGMTIEMGQMTGTIDPAPLFKGLQDDRCQCAHWGVVLKGSMRYRYADHDEVYSAGEIYYAPPGHLPVLEAGVEYVEFSATDDLAKTMAVVERNMAALGQ